MTQWHIRESSSSRAHQNQRDQPYHCFAYQSIRVAMVTLSDSYTLSLCVSIHTMCWIIYCITEAHVYEFSMYSAVQTPLNAVCVSAPRPMLSFCHVDISQCATNAAAVFIIVLCAELLFKRHVQRLRPKNKYYTHTHTYTYWQERFPQRSEISLFII